MDKNSVNHDLCKKCLLCIDVCPVKMIGVDDDGLVNFIPEREKICLECGQCMAVCTSEAVKIKKYSYEENFYMLPPKNIDNDKFINFLASRRSIRNFKEREVSQEVLLKITDSLQYAPYGASPDKVELTIINKRETIEKALPLAEKFLDDIIKWVDSPIVSRIIKYKKGVETFNTIKNHLYPMSKLENYKLKYGDRITRGAPALIILHARPDAEEHTNNALIYAAYLMLTIHAMGLGATMNGIIPAAINKVKKIREIYKIPAEHEAVISIMLGYPRYKYQKAIKREHKIINWVS